MQVQTLLRRSAAAAGAAALAALAPGAATTPAAIDAASISPRLTRDVPRFVTRACESARREASLPVVCPPLVPVTRYRTLPGLSGSVLGPTRHRIYLLTFNNGDSGPAYRHWIAGMGTREAIRTSVLSDASNVVKGKPKRVGTSLVGRRNAEIWRFPEHPAGGGFGSHVAAITRSGPYFALASVHGYDTRTASARVAVALARRADARR